jgi:hypothetical protein
LRFLCLFAAIPVFCDLCVLSRLSLSACYLSTISLPIISIVHEFVPNSRLAWFGKSKGLDTVFYHIWYLIPTSDGCQMITEEVVQGPGAVIFRDEDPSAPHRGHEAWLKGLKQVSENPS